MTYRMLACDYDGTVAEQGRLSPQAETALQRARAAGVALALVTGRILEELFVICPQLGMFDMVVAENGSLLHLPPANATFELGAAPPPAFSAALDRWGVPYTPGRIMIASYRSYEQPVRAAMTELDLQRDIILNKNDLMVLPPGVDKASGLQAGLERLGIAAAAVVGIGDAENDLALFRAVGLRVAVGNALDVLKAQADLVMQAPNGAGVTEFVTTHLLPT